MLAFPAIRPMTRGFGLFLLALCVSLISRATWASDIYDAAIKSDLGLPLDGPLLCTRCHASLIGGEMSVIKPFGLSAMKLGLRKSDEPKLREVLRQMEATNVDSDCDGIGDIAELRTGGDPNAGEADAALEAGVACANAVEPPRYGCYCSLSVQSAKKGTGPSHVALGSAGMFVVMLVLRRSPRARRADAITSARSRRRTGQMGCPP
jgi:hypothetical protein